MPSCYDSLPIPPVDPLRFWAQVAVAGDGDCWEWLGGRSGGYGSMHVGRRSYRPHRIAAVLAGKDVAGLVVDHLCGNRLCCNPAHLEPCTQQLNSKRGGSGNWFGAVQRAKTHCPQGHPYAGSNLVLRPGGRRGCRECQRIDSLARYHRRRAEGDS